MDEDEDEDEDDDYDDADDDEDEDDDDDDDDDDDGRDDDDDGRGDDECFARQVEGRGNLHAGRFVTTASFGPSPPLRRDESRGALAPTGRTGAVR